MRKNYDETEESAKISNLYGDQASSDQKQVKCLTQLNFLFDMIFFGFGMSLLILGMLFLTIYGYKYSFNNISITLIASVFIGVSLLLIAIPLITITSILNRIMCLVMTSVMFLLFVLLLVFGILALTNLANETLADTLGSNMMSAFKKYDRSNSDSYANRNVDWLQEELACCGVNSYTDWRTIFLYEGKYKLNDYSGQSLYNNMPYADFMPDSCCVDVKQGCAKKFTVGSLVNEPSRSEIVYIRGCKTPYLNKLLKDSKFLGILAVCVSSLGIVLTSTQFIINFMIKNKEKNYGI